MNTLLSNELFIVRRVRNVLNNLRSSNDDPMK